MTDGSLSSRQGRARVTALSPAEGVGPRKAYRTHRCGRRPTGPAPLSPEIDLDTPCGLHVSTRDSSSHSLLPGHPSARRGQEPWWHAGKGVWDHTVHRCASRWQHKPSGTGAVFFFLSGSILLSETLTSLWGAHSGFYQPDCQEILPRVSHKPFPPSFYSKGKCLEEAPRTRG